MPTHKQSEEAPLQHAGLCCVQGKTPPVQAALDLYHLLSESGTDLRQPVGLQKQLLQEYSLDADVGQSILQLLQVTSSPVYPSLASCCCTVLNLCFP